YDAAKKDMIKRLNKQPEDFFLTRKVTREKFKNIVDWGQKYTFFGSPIYLEFLAGKRDLHCTAWAIPTRNVKGWKAPCYLMTNGRGHLTGKKDSVQANIQQVLAQREVAAAVAAEKPGSSCA